MSSTVSNLARIAAEMSGKPVAVIAASTEPELHDVETPHASSFLAQYNDAATAIGFAPPALDVERFKALCAEYGIRHYDRAAVKSYLDVKYGGESRAAKTRGSRDPYTGLREEITYHQATWGWRPLSGPHGGLKFMPSESDRLLDGAANYDKPIPYPVLLTAQRIKQVAPSAVFYASDEIREADMPAVRDPFLGVRIGGEFFIVEKWDEPEFRG